MADKTDIAFKVSIDGAGTGTKSLLDLKKEFKELQVELSKTKEGTAEYIATLAKLGKTKEELGDLRNTINSLNPEGKIAAFQKVTNSLAAGFEAATGAAALFGLQSEETEKALLKVQGAMAFAQGIKELAGLKDAFQAFNVVVRANPIGAVVIAITALAAAAALLYKNYQDTTKASANLELQQNELKETNDKLTKSIDIQITSLKGLKSNEEEINKLSEQKLKLNIANEQASLRTAIAKQKEAEAEFDYMEQSLRFLGKTKEADAIRLIRTKEQREATETALTGLKSSIADLQAFHNEVEQKKLDVTKDANQKSVADAKRSAKEKADAEKKYMDEVLAYQKQAREEINKYIHDQNDEGRKRLESKHEEDLVLEDDLTAQFIANQDKQTKAKEDAETKKREQNQKTFDQTISGTSQAVQKTQQIFDLYFQWQLKQNKGNAKAELEIRRKQFQVNKAFGITGSIIDGIGAVQKALNNPYPLNLILAVLTGVLATANTIKIATTKFDDGGSGSTASDVAPNINTGAAPTIPQPNNTTTSISDTGRVTTKPQPQKVFVLESDIRDSNKRITNIEETAKI